MELLTPDYGLLIWTALTLISLLLIIYSFIHLIRNEGLSSSVSLQWALVIFFVPILGAILYLKKNKRKKSGIPLWEFLIGKRTTSNSYEKQGWNTTLHWKIINRQ